MRIRKRHIATPLAILLLASSTYFLKENKTKANTYLKNIIESFSPSTLNEPIEIKEAYINYKLTKPIKIEEVCVYAKKLRFEDIDKEKRKEYILKKDLNHYIDSLYSKIKIPKEVSKDLFKKIIKQESAYNIYALSKRDARGLGQIKEIAWNDLEKIIPYEPGVYNPAKNLEVSLKHLKWGYYYNKNKNPHWNNLSLNEKRAYILTTYNWGPGNLRKSNWDLKKSPKETKKYIENIL